MGVLRPLSRAHCAQQSPRAQIWGRKIYTNSGAGDGLVVVVMAIAMVIVITVMVVIALMIMVVSNRSRAFGWSAKESKRDSRT